MRETTNFLKDKILDAEIKKVKNPTFKIGTLLIYSPCSSAFKSTYFNYLKEISKRTNQSLNPNEFFTKKGSMYIQKRKEPRIKITKEVKDLSLDIEGVDICDFDDISLNGLGFKTKDKLKHGQKLFTTIKFKNHELNICCEVRHIRVLSER